MQKSIFDDPLHFFDKELFDQRKHKYALGIFFLFLVSAIWIASSVLSQYLYTECDFDSPFLVTYIGVCLFAFIIPFKYMTDKIGFTRDPTCGSATVVVESTAFASCKCIESILPSDDISIATTYRDLKEQRKNREREKRKQEKVKKAKQEYKVTIDNDKIDIAVERGKHASLMDENETGNEHRTEFENKHNYNTDVISVSSSFSTSVMLDLNHPGPNWNHSKHIFVALHIAPVLFIANWLFNASLQSTSVTSATVLVSTSSLFVFIMAVIAKEEKFHILKLVGVLLGIVGSVFTARHDFNVKDDYDLYTIRSVDDATDIGDDYYSSPFSSNSNGNTELYYNCTTADCNYNMWGDTLAILAAVAFGSYVVQVRLLCPLDEELYSMGLLLGYIGLVIMIPLLPLAIVLMTKIKMTWDVFFLIVLRGLFDYCLSEYLHFRAVVLTNATIASVGLGLTIPMAFLADFIMKKDNILSACSLIGAIAVSTGFLLVNIFDEDESTTCTTDTTAKAAAGDVGSSNDNEHCYYNADGVPTSIEHPAVPKLATSASIKTTKSTSLNHIHEPDASTTEDSISPTYYKSSVLI